MKTEKNQGFNGFTAKIKYHLHIYPQFIYESFHILHVISLLSRENKNSQLTSLPMCGFIAQLVEHHTGIAEVMGLNPVEALIFFQASSFQLLKLEIHCEDRNRRNARSLISILIGWLCT